MEKVITNRQADSVVAAKLASAVVTSVKTKKTEKASKMVPDFKVTAKQVKDDLVLTVNYQDRKVFFFSGFFSAQKSVPDFPA